jgi:hypothetical protein
MAVKDVSGLRSIIDRDAAKIVSYAKTFEVHSAKDEQALVEIASTLEALSVRVDEIEEAHQLRLKMMRDLMQKLNELESGHQQFAESFKRKTLAE